MFRYRVRISCDEGFNLSRATCVYRLQFTSLFTPPKCLVYSQIGLQRLESNASVSARPRRYVCLPIRQHVCLTLPQAIRSVSLSVNVSASPSIFLCPSTGLRTNECLAAVRLDFSIAEATCFSHSTSGNVLVRLHIRQLVCLTLPQATWVE